MITVDKYTQQAIENLSRFRWEKTWTFWPRRCRITQKRMPMCSTAYRGYKILNGPCEDILLTRWLSKESFMFERLRGNV